MQKFKAIFSRGIILLFFQSCATAGANFQFGGPETMIVGKTTQSEIRNKYGVPFNVGVEDGSTKWTYGYYRYKVFGKSQTKDLDLTFNKDGVVSNYTYASSDPEEIIQSIKK